MNLRRCVYSVVFFAAAHAWAPAGEDGATGSKDAEGKEKRPPVTVGVQRDDKAPVNPQEPEKLAPEAPFADARMGIAFTLPQGFSRLNEDEYRAAVTRLSQHLGQEAGARMMQQAPLYFKGPTRDNKLAPSLSISMSAGGTKFVPEKLEDYRERIRASLEKSNVRHGTISAKLVKVGPQFALRADHEIFSVEDNSRQSVTMLLVPGADRQCDIVFNYSKGQESTVDRAFDKIAETFKFVDGGAKSSGTRDWGRVFLWTGGAFVFGIALSFVLRAVNRAAGPAGDTK